MYQQYQTIIQTPGRSILDITKEIEKFVLQAGVSIGLCHVFLHHTSASLLICENADPLVQQDLESFMQRLIPDGDAICSHVAEGPDDMPSHIRTILTASFLNIPITKGKLALGTWQGLYLWEHRLKGYHRRLTITIHGE